MCLKRKSLTFNERRNFFAQLDDRYPEEENEFPTNFIKTSRYTALDFLPLTLLIQFKRYANIYFLITAIL